MDYGVSIPTRKSQAMRKISARLVGLGHARIVRRSATSQFIQPISIHQDELHICMIVTSHDASKVAAHSYLSRGCCQHRAVLYPARTYERALITMPNIGCKA